MKKWLLNLLTCPYCDTEDGLKLIPEDPSTDEISNGVLQCQKCDKNYLINEGIPRFVNPEEDYAKNFGAQWNQFRVTQIDRISEHNLSRSRLLNDTKWPVDWIQGKLILDAGCGAGRFADELAQCGATVVACDLSSAVNACKTNVDNKIRYTSNRGEVEVVQADLMAMPFKKNIFDGIHCAGVIQHTPDPERIMTALPSHLLAKGKLFYNFYEIDPFTKYQVLKYLFRRWTPKWRMGTLVKFSRWLCYVFFIPSLIMSRVPIIRFFNRFLPICSVHPYGVNLKQQFQLTLLDTIDWYGPQYEIRQFHKRIAELLEKKGLDEIKSEKGFVWAIQRRNKH